MLPEITAEEYSCALDETADAALTTAGVLTPPVNALAVARRLGLEVAASPFQVERARFVSLAVPETKAARGSILLRDEPRRERRQWAVAHEIGEQAAHQVFRRLSVDPAEARPTAREEVANHLAARLLLPARWFARDAPDCGWDLLELKIRYATASHELIARRMLDFPLPVIITIIDQGRLTFRRSNLPGRPPRLLPCERTCRESIAKSQAPQQALEIGYEVQGWPVYEAAWRREILRCHVTGAGDVDDAGDPLVT